MVWSTCIQTIGFSLNFSAPCVFQLVIVLQRLGCWRCRLFQQRKGLAETLLTYIVKASCTSKSFMWNSSCMISQFWELIIRQGVEDGIEVYFDLSSSTQNGCLEIAVKSSCRSLKVTKNLELPSPFAEHCLGHKTLATWQDLCVPSSILCRGSYHYDSGQEDWAHDWGAEPTKRWQQTFEVWHALQPVHVQTIPAPPEEIQYYLVANSWVQRYSDFFHCTLCLCGFQVSSLIFSNDPSQNLSRIGSRDSSCALHVLHS